MSSHEIRLTEPDARPTAQIVQLHQYLELYSDGEPPRNTLFALSPAPLSGLPGMDGGGGRLLIIDPPDDVSARFVLEGEVALLFTGVARELGLPVVETRAGGVAHLRVGDHFIDIYAQEHGAIVMLPALGLICGGHLGSDLVLPKLVSGSTGDEELETLRLLARLLKRTSFQLYIPAVGNVSRDALEVMERLAADVAYLHAMRRVLPQAVARGDALEEIEVVAESLLPSARNNGAGRQIHEANVETLLTSLNQTNS